MNISDNEIAFFGASVTQQKNGYVDAVASLLNHKVLKFGHGAMHINDAGICYINEVLEKRPKICFLDWFTTEYMNQNGKIELFINTILQKFSAINCRVIFLFFPFQNNETRAEFYIQMKDLCKKNSYEYICIDEELADYSEQEILRDYIHTNPKGSKLYAERIIDYLNKHEQYVIPKNKEPTLYSTVFCKKIHKGGKKFVINGDCEIIGIDIKTGRYSGIVEITNNGKISEENTWDMWSYFVRDKFSFKNIHIAGDCALKVTSQKFDTSSCKKKIDFSKYSKKIVIKEIYYVGNSVKIKGGKSFPYILTVLRGKFDAVLHILHLC